MADITRHAMNTVKGATVQMIEPVADRRLEDLSDLSLALSDESFRTEQKQIKASIAMGYDLNEAYFSIGLKDPKRLKLHRTALTLMTFNPENLMLNYRQRSRLRYSMFMDLLERAKAAKDRKTENQCILAMCKLDASEAQLAQQLGLVRLTQIEGEDGVTGHDPTEYERKINELERKIQDRIDDIRSASEPITIDFQSGSEIRREADNVGTITVSEDPIRGQV